MTPWQRPEDGAGYFEILEGASSDAKPLVIQNSGWDNTQPVLGDFDDTLMFTVRSKEGPFTGRVGIDPATNQPIIAQSDVVEVVWFMRPTKPPDIRKPTPTYITPLTYTLYRRAFLVMPTYQGIPIKIPINSFSDVNYDLSVHSDGAGNYIANSLGDLTKRECRIAHDYAIDGKANHFPHKPDSTKYLPFGEVIDSDGYYVPNPADPRYKRFGEDVVLTNVLAFDVQVWDPTAPVYTVGNPPVAVAPGDPGFPYPPGTKIPASPLPASVGAFVDLNWHNDSWNGLPVYAPWNSNLTLSPFYSSGHPKSQLVANFSAASPTAATYDTWSYHYEHDGIQQPNGGTHPDIGTNGFDDPVDANGYYSANGSTDGIVDDPGERETSPPYPVPLRGIKIRIRCYEPDSRQVHEISIIHSFVPE